MSSKSSNGSPKDSMQANRTRDTEQGSCLRHEESLNNKLLKSIDPDWLLEHKELLDLIANSPTDPAALDQVPRSMPMDFEFTNPNPSAPRRMPLAERSSTQQSPDLNASSSYTCGLQLPAARGFWEAQRQMPEGREQRELSPSVDTPHRQSRSSSLQIPRPSGSLRPASRSERSLSSMGRYSEERRTSGLIPEVSLAARAGSLGATSLQTPYRIQSSSKQNIMLEGGQRALSESALLTSGDESELVKMEQEEEQPARKGPGRKKRTAPILVETEDGETKYVTPAEFRKLRRRITNRLSARRMRKKHAEERNVSQSATRTLEEERNHYKETCERMQQQLDQMELLCHRLHAENQSWKSHWNRMSSDPQSYIFQQQEQSTAIRLGQSALLHSTPMEPPTPAYARPTLQLAMPASHGFDTEFQPTSLGSSLNSPLHASQQTPRMPFIPLGPSPEFLGGVSLLPPGPPLPSRSAGHPMTDQQSSLSRMMDRQF